MRLLQGDCLELMGEIPDGSVDAVITDPPYGIDYQSAWRTDASTRKPKIVNDARPFIWWLHGAARVLGSGGALLCFCRWDVQETFRVAIEAAGLTVRSHVIWDRDWHGMGDLKASFAPQHDIIWFATKGAFRFPDKRPKSVLRFRRPSAEALVHPTEKPVALMADLVRAVTPPGGRVLDCFMGSGTTGVACINTGRDFIGIEKDAGYFEIAKRRIEEAQPPLIGAA